MIFSEKIDPLIADLIKQWNIAEQRIKKAEQVRAGEVVASAIFELRYAGRKIIDSLEIALGTNLDGNQDEHARVHAFVADAIEDCVKAKHDAIDAMMNFVTKWFDEVEKKASLGKVQQYFPNYIEVTNKIQDIQDKITESRRDRLNSRDNIYDEIDQTDYDTVLSLFGSMKRSNDRVGAEIDAERRKNWWLWFFAIAGFAVGIIGIVVGVIGYIATVKHW